MGFPRVPMTTKFKAVGTGKHRRPQRYSQEHGRYLYVALSEVPAADRKRLRLSGVAATTKTRKAKPKPRKRATTAAAKPRRRAVGESTSGTLRRDVVPYGRGAPSRRTAAGDWGVVFNFVRAAGGINHETEGMRFYDTKTLAKRAARSWVEGASFARGGHRMRDAVGFQGFAPSLDKSFKFQSASKDGRYPVKESKAQLSEKDLYNVILGSVDVGGEGRLSGRGKASTVSGLHGDQCRMTAKGVSCNVDGTLRTFGLDNVETVGHYGDEFESLSTRPKKALRGTAKQGKKGLGNTYNPPNGQGSGNWAAVWPNKVRGEYFVTFHRTLSDARGSTAEYLPGKRDGLHGVDIMRKGKRLWAWHSFQTYDSGEALKGPKPVAPTMARLRKAIDVAQKGATLFGAQGSPKRRKRA